MSVLLNNGNGTFAAKVDYPIGLEPASVAATDPTSVAAVDLNGDGKPDLAVSNFYSDTVSVLLNNGNGTFAARVDYPTGWYPVSVAAADFNGDGRVDLATANGGDGTVSVLLSVCLP